MFQKKESTAICHEKGCGVLISKDNCSPVIKVIDKLDVLREEHYFCPQHKKAYWYEVEDYARNRYFRLFEVDKDGKLKKDGRNS